MSFTQIFISAILLDQILGDPKTLPHPVILIGKIINFWHKALFNPHSFSRGLIVCILTLASTGIIVELALYASGYNPIVQVYLLYSAMAWRDLKDETAPVVYALMQNDLPGARKFLALVVGRDTQNLNEHEILRALIETISENSIDGIISVLFFAAIGQLFNVPCLFVWLFKAASTLDSMIGYESFHKFGTPSAKLDDFLNFFPARIGGIIIILAGTLTPRNHLDHEKTCGRKQHNIFKVMPPQNSSNAYDKGVCESILKTCHSKINSSKTHKLALQKQVKHNNISNKGVYRPALKVFLNDRKNHKSPNSAHGESAFAGVLGVRLGGGAFYNGKFKARQFINSEGREPKIFDVLRAWMLLDASCAMFSAMVILFSCII